MRECGTLHPENAGRCIRELLAALRQAPVSPGGRPSRQPGDEVGPILVIPEEGAPLDPPHHDMVQGIGGIQPGATGHSGRSLAQSDESGNVPYVTAKAPTTPGEGNQAFRQSR